MEKEKGADRNFASESSERARGTEVQLRERTFSSKTLEERKITNDSDFLGKSRDARSRSVDSVLVQHMVLVLHCVAS